MQWDFSGKTALVTGASRGIGRAIAARFSESGAGVIGTATRVEERSPALHGIRMLAVDFSKESSISDFLATVKSLNKVDICINNAGVNRIKPIETVTTEDYDTLLAIDLRAPYLVSQAVADHMKSAGWGRIVNVASIWSVLTKTHRTLYTTAKTGLVGMSRSMAVELAPHGILVNTVSPGFVLTDLTRQSLTDEEIGNILTQIPQQRMATPEEIAEVVCFLASPANTYMTGQNIVVDGGFSIV